LGCQYSIKEEEWSGEDLVSETFYAFTGVTLLARLDRAADGSSRAFFYHMTQVDVRSYAAMKRQIVWESKWDSYGAGDGSGHIKQNIRMPVSISTRKQAYITIATVTSIHMPHVICSRTPLFASPTSTDTHIRQIPSQKSIRWVWKR